MAFVMGLAREFRRADWRTWLASMTCSEFRAWTEHFTTVPFAADLIDYEFASLKLNQYLLAGGTDDVSVKDFCLLNPSDEPSEPEEMDDDQLMSAAAFIPGGMRFG
ncbi:phage tail assembly protein T [Edwardsiella tarda]|uniref:phage tail assembly protein T n=1 Tax=Edwardsiella tarda TaxID=636 RepID=UPI00351C322C